MASSRNRAPRCSSGPPWQSCSEGPSGSETSGAERVHECHREQRSRSFAPSFRFSQSVRSGREASEQKMSVRLALVASLAGLLLFGAACAAQQSSAPLHPINDPSARLRFDGFTIMPPQGAHWSIVKHSPEGIVFHRRLPGETNTLMAQASRAQATREVHSIDELKQGRQSRTDCTPRSAVYAFDHERLGRMSNWGRKPEAPHLTIRPLRSHGVLFHVFP